MADPATHSIIASASPSLSQSRSRLQRFADWGDILDIDEPSTTASGESRSSGGLNTFYSGQGVAERLRIIRDAIVYVRRNWKDYGMLMDGFKELLKKRLGDPLPTTGDEGYYSDRLLASSKRWRDGFTSQEGEDDEEYSAIRLYTSEYGFEEIFKMVDNILRTNDTSPEHLSDINSAVFLVELMNVDLFNYVSVTPEANNYQGVVFRGLAATEEQIRSFEELARRSVLERFWAVPLALVSASRDREMALAFARLEVQGQEAEQPKRRLSREAPHERCVDDLCGSGEGTIGVPGRRRGCA
ncbi:hypothetical protein H0H93_015001 [Arthromyces matolae]|nr:hypothetical protein H0H93_015001 [Arthromyces matolae]